MVRSCVTKTQHKKKVPSIELHFGNTNPSPPEQHKSLDAMCRFAKWDNEILNRFSRRYGSERDNGSVCDGPKKLDTVLKEDRQRQQ